MENNSDVVLTTLLEIKEKVGAMDAKLDITNNVLINHIQKDDTAHSDQNTRLTKVEDSQKKVKWIAIGAGVIVTFVWRVVEALGLFNLFHH